MINPTNPEFASGQQSSGQHIADDIQRVIHEPRYWLMTVVLSCALSVLAGGAVYYYMRGQVDLVGTTLSDRINELEGQLVQQTAAQNETEDNTGVPDNNEIIDNDKGIYTNQSVGFSFNFKPGFFGYKPDNNEINVYAKTLLVEELNGPFGYDRETALKDKGALEKGEVGEKIDWDIASHRKTIRLNSNNNYAKEFIVLARNDVCDVAFERKLLFYRNGMQVVITVYGPHDRIIETMPEYFIEDSENCGSTKIWKHENVDDFLEQLDTEKGSGIAQEWYDAFDDVVNSISFM